MNRKEIKLNSKDKSGISIEPNKLYNNICAIMESRLNDINDDIEIAEKYNPANIEKYKNYKKAHEIIMKDLNENLHKSTRNKNNLCIGISIRSNDSCEMPRQYADFCLYHYANSIS